MAKKTYKTRKEYSQHFKKLIELEREAEKQFHIREIQILTGKEREQRGRAILGLKATFKGTIVGGYKVYRFGRPDMPENHQIKVGDVVLVSRTNPLKEGIEGTVYEKGKKYLDIAFSDPPPDLNRGYWRIDLFVNDVTFKRMKHALELFEKGKSEFPEGVILGKEDTPIEVKEEEIKPFNGNLNEYQVTAVRKALGSSPLFLIHGPPGTGKTTTLVEVIEQLVKVKKVKVLATADSNTAVDNLMERLIKREIKVVRIGHPARVSKELIEHSLDYQVQNHEDYKRIEEIEEKIAQIKEVQANYLKPTPQWRRGLSDKQILELARQNRKTRGIKLSKIKSMAKWIELQNEIRKLLEEKKKIENQIVDKIIASSEVVLATNSTAGGEFLQNKTFEVLVLDEASQSTEPSALIPLIKAKKVIMAGDHKQLPPTVLHPDAKDLSYTMFERFIDLYPQASYMLRIQYRMNELIKEFPSEEFYNGELISHESVKNIKLSDIAKGKSENPALDDTPIVFIDTQGKFEEKTRRGSFSKYNPKEAELVKKLVEDLKKMGVPPEDIGVITPYKDHEDYLKQLIPDVEVKTVDGFQGREKEVIIISLVRSNPQEEIGFLEDLRRLNVAITRAKRKLIIVGDAKTLGSNEVYRRLIEFIKKKGKLTSI
ncbi:MAG: IGHMBP2 family helicase [Gammaproteobacteria bacterium]|nr:MAG: IGHMBP2 family helicase [Gammaproteobacteria bacterium]